MTTGYRSRTYRSWESMKWRCKYKIGYADRGITVCARWSTYENFLADMGERPEGRTVDRIDNDGNYEPGNCRWATPSEQMRNRRPFSVEARANMGAANRRRPPGSPRRKCAKDCTCARHVRSGNWRSA